MERLGRRIITGAAVSFALVGCAENPPSSSPSPDPVMPIIRCDPTPRDEISLNNEFFADSLTCGDTAGIVIFKKDSDNSINPVDLEIAPPPNVGNFSIDVSIGPGGTRVTAQIKNGLFTSGKIYLSLTPTPHPSS